MKRAFAILAILFATSPAFADPPFPTVEQMAEWAAYAKPVHLVATKIDGGDFYNKGEPIWVYAYESHPESLTSFIVGLYKAGTLFGGNRARMEKLSEDAAAKFKQLGQQEAGKNREEMERIFHVETRPDGRKVYFCMTGFGPGGGGFMGFTRIGKYDLLVEQIEDSGEDFPPGQTPVETTKYLPDILLRIENHLGEK